MLIYLFIDLQQRFLCFSLDLLERNNKKSNFAIGERIVQLYFLIIKADSTVLRCYCTVRCMRCDGINVTLTGLPVLVQYFSVYSNTCVQLLRLYAVYRVTRTSLFGEVSGACVT